MTSEACPNEDTLRAFLAGRQPADARSSTGAHLDGCAACQKVVAAVGSSSASNTMAASQPAVGPRVEGRLPRGAAVGRYVVLSLVGEGGMGEVYAAYDPELDRKIALKLLLSGRVSGDARARTRLLREAKAIAKLSHPNVIVVYDAGTFEDRVFVAMEFVEGQTLKDWLVAAPRERREVLEVFTDAARGLGAAHAAGLIHRDFKPHNVMVAGNGSVRVMDFGLARQMSTVDDPRTADADAAEDANAAADVSTLVSASVGPGDLTRTGELVGTPMYMAPEQFMATRTDARTDQFSFCVALYEALYHEHPFKSDSLQYHITNVLSGKPHPPPPKHDVPAWLRRALLRGLSLEPAARWPSMNELIVALSRDPARARRRWLAGLGAAAGVAVLGVALARGQHRADSMCKGGPARLAGAWEPAVAAGVEPPRHAAERAAFAREGATGDEIWRRVEPTLDRYASRWLAMYGDACEAAHVRGEQSAETLDLRMACLDQRRLALEALTSVLTTADHVAVNSAVDACNALPAIEVCADLKVLRAGVEPPRDEATRARVEDVRRRAAVAKVLNDTGKHQQAAQQSLALVAEARTIGYQPLLAEVLTVAGQAQISPKDSVELLEEALWAALASGREDVAAEAGALLVGWEGYVFADHEQGRRWARMTHALLDHLGEGHERVRAWVLQDEALIEMQENRPASALALCLRALALKEKVLPPDHPDIANSYISIADDLHRLGRDEEALRASEKAEAGLLRAYGPTASELGQVLSNRGEYLAALGRAADAIPVFRDALARWRAQVGPSHAFLAYPLTGLGQALLATGRAEAALEPLERARTLRDAGESDRALIGETRFALARALAARGRREDRARARSLAADARDDYTRAGQHAAQVVAIDAFLASVLPGAR